jgi:DNA-binding SARP family transcriptional activator
VWGEKLTTRSAFAAHGGHPTQRSLPSRLDIRLGLLRGFELTSAQKVVHLPISAQRLLAFLALHDRPLQRTYVAGSLWLKQNEARAQACLRSALWRLSRQGRPLVDARGGNLQLFPSIRVDYRHAAETARRILGDGEAAHSQDLDELTRAGELLPDWYDDWVMIERERLHQLRLHALEVLCRRFAAAGSFGPAVEAGLAAVLGEPLRESAQRALIEAHLAEGNRSEAIRQFNIYRDQLHAELGLDPSPALRRLVMGVKGADPIVENAPTVN